MGNRDIPGASVSGPFLPQLRSLNFRQTFHEGVAHGRLSAVAFSPDGRELGVAAGNRLLLWSTTKEFALSFPAQINDIVFDPRNRWIATASSDRLVRILDAKSLRLLKTLSGRSDPILALAVSPDGRLLASGGLDKDVILWDTEAGKRLHRLQGHTDWIRVIAFSPDGQHLASGSDEKTIRIWSADSGKLLNTLKTVSEVEGLSFTPDGRSLASGTDNGILQIWSFACGSAVCLDGDIPAPKSVSMRNVRGESGPFDFSFQNLRRIQQSAGRLALSPDGHWLARGEKRCRGNTRNARLAIIGHSRTSDRRNHFTFQPRRPLSRLRHRPIRPLVGHDPRSSDKDHSRAARPEFRLEFTACRSTARRVCKGTRFQSIRRLACSTISGRRALMGYPYW